MRYTAGYKVTVKRGERAGLVKPYMPTAIGGMDKARQGAYRFADRLDREYGAICSSVSPVWADMSEAPDAAAYRCTPASIAAEHAAEVSFITAQGFVAASNQAER